MAITGNCVLVLSGPTGVGKTALALSLAERLGTDILSADSRQVYRGLDIGTAKPTAADRARVPHRWVDALDIGEPTSAGAFSREADRHIDRCRADGRPALVVGGSTLYVDAVVRGLSDLPEVPGEIAAAALEDAATPAGRNRLFHELRSADPTAAATLDATKSQRLARLVGLLRATGRRPSELWSEGRRARPDVRLVVLNRPRESLYERIEARVDEMLSAGLVNENRALLSAGHPANTPCFRTIGYQEPMRFLRGDIDESEMVRLLKQNTRRYAKRQLTWLRRYPDALWLDAAATSSEQIVAMQ